MKTALQNIQECAGILYGLADNLRKQRQITRDRPSPPHPRMIALRATRKKRCAEVIAMKKSGMTFRAISRKFGVSPCRVSEIYQQAVHDSPQ